MLNININTKKVVQMKIANVITNMMELMKKISKQLWIKLKLIEIQQYKL